MKPHGSFVETNESLSFLDGKITQGIHPKESQWHPSEEQIFEIKCVTTLRELNYRIKITL